MAEQQMGIEFIGIEKWEELIRTYSSEAIKELETTCLLSANTMRNDWMTKIQETNAVGATGEYHRSIVIEQHKVDDNVVSDCKSKAPHAVYVEYGTSPGWGAKAATRKMPPIDALMTWVQRKAIGFGRSVKKGGAGGWGKPGSAKRNAQEAEARSIAFLIARKIGKFGSPPKPCFEPSYSMAVENFDRNLNEAMDRVEQRAKQAGGAA